jgi:hypothetical protein
MPPADVVAPAVDPNELIVDVLRRHKPAEPPLPAEAPLIVIMGALDPGQVETFARGKGVGNVDALFLRELDNANLWHFARRPLDLEWLVEHWQASGAFGSLAAMLELSLQKRLVEPDLQRAPSDPIDADRAMAALERIGAALVFERRRTSLCQTVISTWSAVGAGSIGRDPARLVGRTPHTAHKSSGLRPCERWICAAPQRQPGRRQKLPDRPMAETADGRQLPEKGGRGPPVYHHLRRPSCNPVNAPDGRLALLMEL